MLQEQPSDAPRATFSQSLNIVIFLMSRFGRSAKAGVEEESSSAIGGGRNTVSPQLSPSSSSVPAMTRRIAHSLIERGFVAVNNTVVQDAKTAPLIPHSAVLVEVASEADLMTSSNGKGGVVVAVATGVPEVKRELALRVWIYDKPEGINCDLKEHDPCSLIHVLREGGFDAGRSSGESQEDPLSVNGNVENVVVAPEEVTATLAGSQQKKQPPCSSPWKPRLFPIGRLDKDSCGMLLLTNSGPLCERLLHPGFNHEKQYVVTLNHKRGTVPPLFYNLMRNGVSWVSKNTTFTSQPCEVEPLSVDVLPQMLPVASVMPPKKRKQIEARVVDGEVFTIILKEGLNRQIRHMVETAGRLVQESEPGEDKIGAAVDVVTSVDKKAIPPLAYRVMRLQRVRTGPLLLDPVVALMTRCLSPQRDENGTVEQPQQTQRYGATLDAVGPSRISEVAKEDVERLVAWAFQQ